MRKILIIALGLASLSALVTVEQASAGQTCRARCVRIVHKIENGVPVSMCQAYIQECSTPNAQGPGTSATQSINQLKNQKKF